LALCLTALVGCVQPEDDPPKVVPSPDERDTGIQTDVNGDTGSEPDSADPDTATPVDTGIPDECSQADPTPLAERSPVELSGWVIGSPDNNGNSQLLSDIRSGNFEVPDRIEYGATWTDTSQNDEGEIDVSSISSRGSVGYAATTVEVSERTVVGAETDDFYRVFVNDATHPGGVYGHGDKMQPLELEPGTNTVVVQFVSGRNSAPKLNLFETPDPVAYNPEDLTSPEPRVDSSAEQPLGLPVLNLSGRTLKDVEARVLENDYLEATTVEYPFLGRTTATQLSFDLKPKSPWSSAGETIPVQIAVTSCGMTEAYKTTLELETVDSGEAFRRTFRSPVDGSTQYYGVLPPKDFGPSKEYGLTLTLHGAGVDAKGQATAYTRKEDLYIVAPTNRRKFGFDWEEWGKFNGINALDHAMEQYPIDPKRVYLTGHSMGGHGTWHLGVTHPGRFATIGPSAGWESFYNYGGDTDKPNGAIRRARAHSETANYLSNLVDRGAYIIHGGADNNVPTEHGRTMRDKLRKHTTDVKYHEEPGAEHWWDRDEIPGTACVNWPPLFDFFADHQLDPTELGFQFKSPGPWYADEHSYVRVRSSQTPMEDFELLSSRSDATTVSLQTTNVRSLEIDGEALDEKGIETVEVDGISQEVEAKTMILGPRSGKKPGKNGTFNQVLREPFCFVYPPDKPYFRKYASNLVTNWTFRGNGHACALPSSELDAEIREARNLVYVGADFEHVPEHEDRPFGWSDSEIRIGPNTYEQGAMQLAFPTDDGMGAVLTAVEGSENQLYRIRPFSSRNGMPDYLAFSASGGLAFGFFDNQWKYDPSLGSAR